MVVGAITNLSAMISNGFNSLIQQIGPNYDPLFYDVMVYIFVQFYSRSSYLE